MDRTLRLLSVVAPLYEEEALVEAFHARVCAALERIPFELVLVDDGSSDRTPRLLADAGGAGPARAGDPAVAQLRSPDGAHGRPRPRARRRRRDARRRPAGPARADPRDARPLAPRDRRRLRGAPPARRRDALQAGDRALVLSPLQRRRRRPARAGLGRLPPARPRTARRAAVDARAQPLPARDDRVGRLHADRRPLRARCAPRRRDEVHAAAHADLLARRDLVVLAPAAADRDARRLPLRRARVRADPRDRRRCGSPAPTCPASRRSRSSCCCSAGSS